MSGQGTPGQSKVAKNTKDLATLLWPEDRTCCQVQPSRLKYDETVTVDTIHMVTMLQVREVGVKCRNCNTNCGEAELGSRRSFPNTEENFNWKEKITKENKTVDLNQSKKSSECCKLS